MTLSKQNNYTDIQKALLQEIKKYRLKNIEPFMEDDDENEYFRMEIFKGLSELGVTSIGIDEAYGGVNLGLAEFSLSLTEIAKSSVGHAVTISVSNMVQTMINKFGTTEQKQKYLPDLCNGNEIASFALSESCSGSDAASLKTKAIKTDKGYILNGTKMWITSGGLSSTYLVMARTGEQGPKGISCFLVKKDTPGFTFGKKEKKMGWRISPTRELIFENCLIGHDQLLGQVGQGFQIAMTALDKGRVTIGSIAVGVATRCIDESLNYMLQRKQFNKNIFDFQGLQFLLADMATEAKASQLLIREAATMYDQNQEISLISAMAKLKSTDTAMRVSTDSIQILGGVGFTKEFPLERFMRDAKALQIVEGTNQIQKVVIARNLKQMKE